MVKKFVGLPEGYDLKVTPKDLLDEPVSLAGYLDEKPSIIRPSIQAQVEKQVVAPALETPKQEQPKTETPIPKVEERVSRPLEVVEGGTNKKVQRERSLRLQINITPEVERKAQELVDIISSQSPDGRVTISELMQALILNLYDARSDINGRLPRRGRWGTASAKSHSAELAIVLREAILKHASQKGSNSFRSAIGG